MSVVPAGFVLAGGRSTRMGRDKALLELEGETLIARGLRQLGAVCSEVAIAGGSAELARFARLIPDERAGEGPLSGLVAGLEAASCEWNLFCPVDVPFVPRGAWETLLRAAAEAAPAGAVLARTGGQVQPLCGLYHRRVASGLRAQLEGGQRRVTSAVSAAGPVLWVDFDESGQQDWFRNANTPGEYDLMAHPTS